MTTEFATARAVERREIERLEAYLARLDADGWSEQSYCREWTVAAVVGHITSGRLAFAEAVDHHWFQGPPPQTREQRQAIAARLNTLPPAELLQEFQRTFHHYTDHLAALPSEASAEAVESFAGKARVQRTHAILLNDLALHA